MLVFHVAATVYSVLVFIRNLFITNQYQDCRNLRNSMQSFERAKRLFLNNSLSNGISCFRPGLFIARISLVGNFHSASVSPSKSARPDIFQVNERISKIVLRKQNNVLKNCRDL